MLREIKVMQETLSHTIAHINVNLTNQNRFPQFLPLYGSHKPHQLYWHQEVEKQVIRKTKSTRKVLKRIPDHVLPDGVHPSAKVTETWFNSLHANFAKFSDSINQSFLAKYVGN